MRYRLVIPLVLILSTLAVFWPVTGFDFVTWDDEANVYKNPYLNPSTIGNTLHFWIEPYIYMYIPLTYTLWSILGWVSQYFPAGLYGQNPHIFHTANLIVHMLSVLAVFSILRILLSHGFKEGENAGVTPDPSKVELAAGLGALIFALHPVQVEPAVWVTGMKDLLCGLFSFLAIREYLAFAVASKTGGAARDRTLHYAIASAAFFLALLSKPTAVVTPLLLIILDRWAVKRTFKEIGYSLAGWFMAAFVFAVVAKMIQQTGVVTVTPPLWARPFIAGDALAFYLYKLILPLQLQIDYGRTPKFVLQHWWIYISWLIPFALAVGAWFSKKREPLLVSLGIFVAALLPVLGLVTFFYQSTSTVADRYLYIPMLGVVLAVSWIIISRPTKLVMSLSLLVILLFGIRGSSQVLTWKNDVALYTNVLKVNRASYASHNNLGNALKKLGNLDEAIAHYNKALEINPNKSGTHHNLGMIMEKKGNLDEALAHYKKAIEIAPYNPNAYHTLGVALEKMDMLDDAISNFEKALKIRPDYSLAHYNLGITLKRQGKFDKAILRFKKAVEIKPDYVDAYNNLGIAYGRLGRLEEAASQIIKALEFRPSDGRAHYNLAVILTEQGKYEEAISHLSEALRIRPDFELAREQLEKTNAKLRKK